MAGRKETARRGKEESRSSTGRRQEAGSRGGESKQADTRPQSTDSRKVVATPSGDVAPKLSLVATPIGNLSDLSDRAKTTLASADLWIVEDTRVSSKLLQILDLKKPMRVANDHTSEFNVGRIVDEIQTGLHAVLLTDGGAPGISDPGALVADECYARGIEVDAIPGPSAVITALMLSGYFAQRFVFLGFMPRKAGEIKQLLQPFADSSMTLVLFESPHRFRELLKVAGDVLPNRRYSICREISKAHQQVFRDNLPTIPDESQVLSKGEFTIVIEGRRKTHGS